MQISILFTDGYLEVQVTKRISWGMAVMEGKIFHLDSLLLYDCWGFDNYWDHKTASPTPPLFLLKVKKNWKEEKKKDCRSSMRDTCGDWKQDNLYGRPSRIPWFLTEQWLHPHWADKIFLVYMSANTVDLILPKLAPLWPIFIISPLPEAVWAEIFWVFSNDNSLCFSTGMPKNPPEQWKVLYLSLSTARWQL